MSVASVFLMTGQGQGGSGFQFVFIGLMILVFWLFMIRPQAKKQKQQKTFMQSLKKGDKVVTISGIHGTVNKLNEDNTFMLEINPGSYIKMEKSAVSMEMTTNLNKVQTAAPIK